MVRAKPVSTRRVRVLCEGNSIGVLQVLGNVTMKSGMSCARKVSGGRSSREAVYTALTPEFLAMNTSQRLTIGARLLDHRPT